MGGRLLGHSEVVAEIHPLGFRCFVTRDAGGVIPEIGCQANAVYRPRRFRVEGHRRKRLVSHDLPRTEERRHNRARLLSKGLTKD